VTVERLSPEGFYRQSGQVGERGTEYNGSEGRAFQEPEQT
jgi:hypothetical protein